MNENEQTKAKMRLASKAIWFLAIGLFLAYTATMLGAFAWVV